jgi:hypothetical protein
MALSALPSPVSDPQAPPANGHASDLTLDDLVERCQRLLDSDAQVDDLDANLAWMLEALRLDDDLRRFYADAGMTATGDLVLCTFDDDDDDRPPYLELAPAWPLAARLDALRRFRRHYPATPLGAHLPRSAMRRRPPHWTDHYLGRLVALEAAHRLPFAPMLAPRERDELADLLNGLGRDFGAEPVPILPGHGLNRASLAPPRPDATTVELVDALAAAPGAPQLPRGAGSRAPGPS